MEDPWLSTLVRRLHYEIRRRVLDQVRARGYDDITQAHISVFQRPGPEGCRPTELARRTIMTKQAMGHLLSALESRGYLRRVPVAGDGRGTTVRLTAKGRRLTEIIHTTAFQIQEEWAQQLGASRMRELIELLDDLDTVATSPPRPQ